MQIVMVSNFMNHHMLPLCLAFDAMPDVDFTFVATTPLAQERVTLGFADMNHAYPFVICAYESEENKRKALELCRDCDVLYIGTMPAIYAKEHLRLGKLAFRHAERMFKGSEGGWKNKARALKWKVLGPKYGSNSPNCYLLCASAFSAADHYRVGLFKDRGYNWGYFTEFKEHDTQALMAAKEPQSIVWAGRFLPLKHAESAVLTADRLKADGYHFSMKIIGNGVMEQELKQMIREKGLEDCVEMTGPMSPEQVRQHMEKGSIYLFTSDRGEGWGAVLNEAMNSGCAVVASHAIGAVPLMMKHEENGLIYRSEDWDDLYAQVRRLMDDPALQRKLGAAAYETIRQEWQPETAAQRLVQLAKALEEGMEDIFPDGPCSRAVEYTDI